MTRAGIHRRTKPSLLRRLRVFWVFIVALLAAAAYGGYVLATWPAFFPKFVAVTGNVHVSAGAIRRKAAIAGDRNVWLIDKRAAERRVDTLPWIRRTQIHRSLPAKVEIAVEERVPVACVVSAASQYLVDASGHVIETACGSELRLAFPPMPAQAAGAMLDGKLLARMLADASVLRSVGLDPVALGFDRYAGLDATLGDGLRLRLGDDRDVAQKAALVGPILQAYGARRAELAAIDLRAPATPVVELRKPKK